MDDFVKVKHPWWVVLGLGLAFLLGSYDITALNLALVWIQKDLSLSLWNIDWVMNAYLITFASFLIPAGRLSDIYGHKLFFLLGTGLMTVVSIAAAFADTATTLILARALQGFSVCLCWPSMQSMIMQIFPKEKVGKALGFMIALGGLGMASGPVISGYLIEAVSWRAVIFMNAPIALIAFILILFLVPKEAFLRKPLPVDFVGLTLLVSFTYSLVYAIALGGKLGFTEKDVYGYLAASIGLFWLFIVREERAKYPLIDLQKLHSTDFIVGMVFRGTAAFGLFSFLFLTGYALQHIAILEANDAGLYFLPFTISFAIFAYIGGRLAKHISTYSLMYLGMWLMGIGFIAYATVIKFSIGFLAIGAPFLFIGIGLGLFAPNNTLFAIRSLPKSHWGVGIGILFMVNLVISSIAIIIASYFMKSPGYQLAIQLLKAKQIDLSEFKISLLNAVMRGMRTIPDTLLQFSDHTKEVYEAIKVAFLQAMSIDLYVAAGLLLIPLSIYTLVKNR